MPWKRRTPAVLVAVAALALSGSAAATADTGRTLDTKPFPNRIVLPHGFQPEGIAIGPGPVAYFGSLRDGDIYAADLRTGEGHIVSQGPGTPSVGMKTDRSGRLFVSGGSSGSARVVDTSTGRVLASYQLATGPSFVNDVVLTARMAWFTDSMSAVLYGVPIAADGTLGDATDVVRLRLRGQWEQVADAFNANGIARTPDREALLVVNSTTGSLYRVNPTTGYSRKVDLGGLMLTNGDGLLVQDQTLYAVQNQLNRVVEVELNRRGTEGELVRTLVSPGFDVPTTVAAYGKRLYLPNARFGTPPQPATRYWASVVIRG